MSIIKKKNIEKTIAKSFHRHTLHMHSRIIQKGLTKFEGKDSK